MRRGNVPWRGIVAPVGQYRWYELSGHSRVLWRGIVVLVGLLVVCLGGFGGWLGWRYWGVGLLRADYPPPPPDRTVSFDSATYSVTEGETVLITVLLSSPAEETVRVDYQVVDSEGNIVDSGTISFAPGETSYTYTFTAPDDSCPNPDIVLTLSLSNPQGGNTALGEPSTATLTISDNDTSATCEICR